MPVVNCAHCGSHYRVHAKLSGRQVKCRDCGEALTVPGELARSPLVGSSSATSARGASPRVDEPQPFVTNELFQGFTKPGATPPAAAAMSQPQRAAQPVFAAAPAAFAPARATVTSSAKETNALEPEYFPETPTEELARAVNNRKAVAPARRFEWTGSASQTGTVGGIILVILLIGLRVYNRMERNAMREESRQAERDAEAQMRSQYYQEERRRILEQAEADRQRNAEHFRRPPR